MTTVHIFDIDTTIADNKHRARLLEKTCVVCLGKKNYEYHDPCPTCGKVTRSHVPQECWDRFFDNELIKQDIPEYKAFMYAQRIRERGGLIHYITGRDYRCEDVTMWWLNTKFGRKDGEDLIVRAEDETELSASEYKNKAFIKLCNRHGWSGQDETFIFYEDDPFCLAMYQKHGIVVRCPEAWEHLMPDLPAGVEMPFATL